jgi:hypothetical protein
VPSLTEWSLKCVAGTAGATMHAGWDADMHARTQTEVSIIKMEVAGVVSQAPEQKYKANGNPK